MLNFLLAVISIFFAVSLIIYFALIPMTKRVSTSDTKKE